MSRNDDAITKENPSRTRISRRPIFVVQEHHASTLHYDFRLEVDGVLKSWAVPKGPSMDPSHRRLAVQVADHALGYATFEGHIPAGQYGAGSVQIWDRGTFEFLPDPNADRQSAGEAIDAGRIEFILHGERLKGAFVLVRMAPRGRDNRQWLLIKRRDAFANSAAESADS
jgi:bifunctional non-homologous end joining protein LigD